MKILKTITKLTIGIGVLDLGISNLLFNEVFTRQKEEKRYFLNKFLNHDGYNIYDKYNNLKEQGQQWLQEIKPLTESWTLQSYDGLKLQALFIPAESESRKTIICVHGYHSTGQREYVLMSRLFHDAGYNVLLIDHRAHGLSEGKYISFGCLERNDIYGWVNKVNEKYNGKCDIFLHGVSMGAATVLMASGMNLPSTVKGIIADCGYTSPSAILHSVVRSDVLKIPFSDTLIASIDMLCKFKAHYSLNECSSLEEVSKTKCPIFIIHGDKDILVPVTMAKEIYQACSSHKKLWIVHGANHAESSCMNPEKYQKKVIEFLDECLNETSRKDFQ